MRGLENIDLANINHVEVINSEREYLIVTKVHGTLAGDTFLDSIESIINPALSFAEQLACARKNIKLLEQEGKNEVANKLKKLLLQLSALSKVKEMKNSLSTEARQFVYDETKDDWYLVDFERLNSTDKKCAGGSLPSS